MQQTTMNPWHQRRAQHEHYRRFEHLLQIHRLTEAWIAEVVKVGAGRQSHALDRGLSPEIAQNLWMLGSLETPAGLDSLLDDTSADDVLGRLERTVWSVQAYTMSRLLDQAKAPEKSILSSLLEQVSWKQGREAAEKAWVGLAPEARRNLKLAILTLQDTAFVPRFLIQRATEREARIGLLQCPHSSPFNEVRNVADDLCANHGHWARGFAYGLNSMIALQCSRIDERCQQVWTLEEAVD